MGRTLKFGISRSNGGPHLLGGAYRFADACAAAIDSPMSVAVAYDYERLLRNLLDGTLDLAWMPPLIHARAAAQGARLVAVSERGGRLFYRGALLVRASTGWRTLGEVKRARAAWVDRGSSSGYLFPRLHIAAAGFDLERVLAGERFYGSAANACHAASRGEADLCACFVSAAETVPDAQREVEATFGRAVEGLSVIELTDPIPPDGIAFGPAASGPELDACERHLRLLHETPDGREALRALFQAERLMPVTPRIARALERLRADVARSTAPAK